MKTKDQVKLRGYIETSDKGLLFNAILKSQRDLYKDTTDDVYYSGMQDRLANLFKDPAVLITLAVNPNDEDQIYGFSVTSKLGSTNVIHYVYVKHPFRKFGIAKMLLEGKYEKGFFYTSRPKKQFRIDNAIYLPFYFEK